MKTYQATHLSPPEPHLEHVCEMKPILETVQVLVGGLRAFTQAPGLLRLAST